MIEHVKFTLDSSESRLPNRKNPTDAGLDLFANITGLMEYQSVLGRISIHPGEVVIMRTGVRVEVPEGYFAWITNKSRYDFLIGGGIVDQGYRGELLVKIVNPTKEVITIKHGDAIAQLIFIPTIYPIPVEVDELNTNTDRGADGGIARQVGEL